MEWSSDADTSFSSLNPTSSKEDVFSPSLISSTSDVDINMTLQLDTPLSSPLSTDSSLPSLCSPGPQEDHNCRKSKILPPSLLLSVTKKVRDGTVSKSDISSNDLKTCSSPGFFINDSDSSNKLLPQISPLSVNSFVDSPSRLVNDSNISDIDSNSSLLKVEVSGDSDDKALSANSDTSICTIYSDDETRNKLQVEKPTRRIPNYFISIQFSDPEIYSSLKEVHKSVMKKNGNYSLAVVPLHSLHMTLAVMRLENEEDMARAKSALNRCGDELRPKYRHELLVLPLQGLGNFRHSVVFAKVHPGEHVAKLEEIADVVQKKFCEEGLVDDKHNFTSHVTVLKLSRVGKKLTKKTGLKKIYPDIYEEFVDTYFGTQKVHSLQLCSMLKAKDISGYYYVEHKIDFGVEITPDNDGSTPMTMVNGERKEDSLSETIIESATKQNPEPTDSKNPEDITLQDDILTNKSSSEKKVELECDITREFLNKVMYPYKSEMFIHIAGQENDNTPSTLSVSQEEAVADNPRAKIVTTTLQEEALTDNISLVPINLPENMLTSDKLMFDEQEIQIALEVTEKVLENEADVANYETSSGKAPLHEAVSTKTDLSYITALPTLIITQAETITDKAAALTDITDIEVNSTLISLKEASITTISDSTGNVTPQIPTTFQDITLTNDTGVSDVSEGAETADKCSQVSSPSHVLLGDLELAEEATEGLASSDLIGLLSGHDRPEGHNLVSKETGEDKDASSVTGEDKDASSVTSETVESLNIVPPHMKKRRKKMGKCSLM